MAGIQGGWLLGNYGNLNLGQLDLMKAVGATDVRINFRLGAYYQDWQHAGADGSYALSKYDTIIKSAQDHGMRVLGLLSNESWQGYQADWTANHAGSGDNPYMQGFAQAALMLISHFGSAVWAWEIWNEPDAWTTAPGQGGSFIYPSNFVALLRNVHAVVPKSTVLVSGGLFVNDLATPPYSATYMDQVWNILGNERPFDMVGEHIYIRNASQVPYYFNAVNRKGLPGVVTEIGWRTDAVSMVQQANNLNTAYRLLGMPEYTYWFSIQDGSEKYGLFDLAGNPKPAVQAFKGVGAMDQQFDDVWSKGQAPAGTGMANFIKSVFLSGKISACFALVPEFETVDWSGTPIHYMVLSNGLHGEYNTVSGSFHVYDTQNHLIA